MTAEKKPRGRPKGTGIDDGPVLLQMAKLIAAEPGLKPTTALKRIVKRPRESLVRRIQIKWKCDGAGLLLKLQVRRSEGRAKTSVALHEIALMRAAQRAAQAHAIMAGMLGMGENPTLRAMREIRSSTFASVMDQLLNSMAFRMAREVQNSPAMRVALEMQNSPAMQLARHIESSPEMRMMREVRDVMLGIRFTL